MNTLEKIKLTEGLGDWGAIMRYVAWWTDHVHAVDRESAAVHDAAHGRDGLFPSDHTVGRAAAWGAAGYPTEQPWAPALAQFRGGAAGALDWRDGEIVGGWGLVGGCWRLAWGSWTNLRLCGMTGDGVAAGAETGAETGSEKHLDRADLFDFLATFSAHLAPFVAAWATLERVRSSVATREDRVAHVWREGADGSGRYLVRIGPLTWYESALLDAYRQAVRHADNECRAWVNSRGMGAAYDGSSRVATVSIDAGPLSMLGEAGIVRPMDRREGRGALVMVDRRWWDGVRGAADGWSRRARVSTVGEEIETVARLTHGVIRRARPQDRARVAAQYGGMLAELREVVGAGGVSSLSGCGQDGPDGRAAQEIVRARVNRWRDALAEERELQEEEEADARRSAMQIAALCSIEDGGGYLPWPRAESAAEIAAAAAAALAGIRAREEAAARAVATAETVRRSALAREWDGDLTARRAAADVAAAAAVACRRPLRGPGDLVSPLCREIAEDVIETTETTETTILNIRAANRHANAGLLARPAKIDIAALVKISVAIGHGGANVAPLVVA